MTSAAVSTTQPRWAVVTGTLLAIALGLGIFAASFRPTRNHITQASWEEVGLAWPLNVPDALVGCERVSPLSLRAKWIEVGGKRYAVNGIAADHLKLPLMDPVQKIDAASTRMIQAAGGEGGLFVSDRDLQDYVGKLCE